MVRNFDSEARMLEAVLCSLMTWPWVSDRLRKDRAWQPAFTEDPYVVTVQDRGCNRLRARPLWD